MKFRLINVEILKYKNQHFSLWHGERELSQQHIHLRISDHFAEQNALDWVLSGAPRLHWVVKEQHAVHPQGLPALIFCCFICTEKHGDAISHKPSRKKRTNVITSRSRVREKSAVSAQENLGWPSWLNL